jgi:molybdate transport system substrate-binding protein
VFAASSLTDAFEELGRVYQEEHPDLAVTINFGSSSTLATQLIEGAAADVYASANQAQMQRVADAGLVLATPEEFASNRLTVILPADNPGEIDSIDDLAKPGLVLVLAAPGVPVREYTDQTIAMLGDVEWQAAVYRNLVSEEENVRIVVTKVALGEAGAGIVYTSDVTPEVADQLIQLAIPDEDNVAAVYPIAVMDAAPHPDRAEEFVAFVLSARGQAILQKWGFGPSP